MKERMIEETSHDIYTAQMYLWKSLDLSKEADFYLIKVNGRTCMAFGLKIQEKYAEFCIKIVCLRDMICAYKLAEQFIYKKLQGHNIGQIFLSVLYSKWRFNYLRKMGFESCAHFRNHYKVNGKLYDIIVLRKTWYV